MKEEQENQQENAEQYGKSSSNFLGDIPEAWKRRARAAFGYIFCVTLFIVILSETAAGIFPAVKWFTVVSTVLRHIGTQLYHYSLGLGTAIIAYYLAWENIMYLREKRRREKAEALAAAVNAELQRAREEAEATNAQLQERISALETEVTELRRALNGAAARSPSSNDEDS